MKHRRAVDKLSKFLVYVLGRRPDEFGLLPDENGYMKVRELMKTLGEEPGWRHVRLNHIREVIHGAGLPPVEIDGNRIRAVERSHLPVPEIPEFVPKLLYHPVRRRAYPVVLENGLSSDDSGYRIILAGDMELARRLGRRIDPDPVILTVHSDRAREKGAVIWRFGELLFPCDGLPPGSFTGPPLPKDRPGSKKKDPPKPKAPPKAPGSYFPDLTTDSTAGDPAGKGSRRRKNQWKRERKRKHRNQAPRWIDE